RECHVEDFVKRFRASRGAGGLGREQRVSQTVNLSLEKLGSTLVPQDKVGSLDFSRQRQLLGDSLPGERARKAALLQSGELFGRSTGDAYREIKPIFQGLFEQQRNLHRPTRAGFRVDRLFPNGKYPRVRGFLQPKAFT